jgi:hypothetical protein
VYCAKAGMRVDCVEVDGVSEDSVQVDGVTADSMRVDGVRVDYGWLMECGWYES